jgi:hypothetical protein
VLELFKKGEEVRSATRTSGVEEIVVLFVVLMFPFDSETIFATNRSCKKFPNRKQCYQSVVTAEQNFGLPF